MIPLRRGIAGFCLIIFIYIFLLKGEEYGAVMGRQIYKADR